MEKKELCPNDLERGPRVPLGKAIVPSMMVLVSVGGLAGLDMVGSSTGRKLRFVFVVPGRSFSHVSLCPDWSGHEPARVVSS